MTIRHMTKVTHLACSSGSSESSACSNAPRMHPRIGTVEVADVRAIRRKLGMSQEAFAETYRCRR